VSLVCASAFAFWNTFSRTATPTINEAELHAALESLAPTEAEAKAIAVLREKTSIQLARLQWKYAQQHAQLQSQRLQMLTDRQNDPSALSLAMTTGSDLELPVEAEPVNDGSIQIAIEYRFFSDTESLSRTITGHPAMEWTVLPVATPFLSTGTPPGTFSRSVSTQMPMHVRYLENDRIEKFYNLFLRRATTVSSKQLPPSVNPIIEASKRGSILAVIRMGNRDMSSTAQKPDDVQTPVAPPGMSPFVPRHDDGFITLNSYGRVYIKGLNASEIIDAINFHFSRFITNEKRKRVWLNDASNPIRGEIQGEWWRGSVPLLHIQMLR